MVAAHIKNQFEADEQNRKAVYARVGAAGALPDDLVGLYETQYAAIANQLPDYAAEVAGALYVACREHLILGVTSLLRCYSSQAFREVRAAVEAAGIANAIRKNEESFRIFREDRDEASRKAARKRFKPASLFVGDLARLQNYYEKASELSHTNRRTFGPHVNFAEKTFYYQDLRDHDIPRLAINYLIWICAAHLTILEIADFVFPDAQGELVEKFRAERQYLGEKICRFDVQNRGNAYQPVDGQAA